MATKPTPIIWAVDPFAEDPKLQRSALAAIETIARGESSRVVPTYVTSMLPADLMKTVREQAEKKLKGIFRGGNGDRNRLQVLAKDFRSTTEGAKFLANYAKRAKAEMIVLSTHARKGPARWLLGSFAETLSAVSDVPLLIARPSWKPKVGGNSVLFATDFSDESKEAFLTMLATAAQRKWSVTIFNYVEFPFVPGFEGIPMVSNVYEDAFREETKAAIKKANQWVALARAKGVSADVRVVSRRKGDFVDALLDLVRKKYLLVAFAARSSKYPQQILGATSRQILRNSPVPVWLMCPSAKEAKARRGSRKKELISESVPVLNDKPAFLI